MTSKKKEPQAPYQLEARPHPGSPEAIKGGCTCAVLDNNHGAGIGGDGERFGWWISGACPMHGAGAPSQQPT